MARAAVDTHAPTAAMRVTTVRFGHDLWQLLEAEAALVGTSVSQYIREASLARAAAAAAARGESAFEQLASAASPARADKAKQARDRAARERENAQALRAQSQQAIAEGTKKADRASRTSRRAPGPPRDT
jgi:hypothetical protein